MFIEFDSAIQTPWNLSVLASTETWPGKLNQDKPNAVEVSDKDGALTGYHFPD